MQGNSISKWLYKLKNKGIVYVTNKQSDKKRNDRSRDLASRHKESWTDAEIDIIMESSLTDPEIGRHIGRSVAAIMSKRCRVLAERNKDSYVGSRDSAVLEVSTVQT